MGRETQSTIGSDRSRGAATPQQPPPSRRLPLEPRASDRERPVSWLTAIADTATATTARVAVPVPVPVPVPASVPASADAITLTAAPDVFGNRTRGGTVKIPISISGMPSPPSCAPVAEDIQKRFAGVPGVIGSSSGSQQQGQEQGQSRLPFRGSTGLELEIMVCQKSVSSFLHTPSAKQGIRLC